MKSHRTIPLDALTTKIVASDLVVRSDDPNGTSKPTAAGVSIGAGNVDRFEVVGTMLRDGIWDWDVASGRVQFSQRWHDLIGIRSGDARTLDEWVHRVHPLDRPAFQDAIDRIRNGDCRTLQSQHRLRHSGGRYRIVEAQGAALLDSSGRPARVIGVTTDLTRQQFVEQKLLFDTYHDPLTALPNRTYFGAILEQAMDRAKAESTYRFAVVVVDLDRFRLINDGLGHATGNRLLLAAAERMRGCLRPDDTLARLAADQFAVLLDYVDSVAEAALVAERMQAAFSHVFDIDGHPLFVSMSAGIAWSSETVRSADVALQQAIAACNHAKSRGRARWEVFQPSMLVDRRDSLRRETDLRRALERNEFCLRYQPIVNVKSGRLTGFEALVRWQHPITGEMEPGDFIPIAEDTGLIVPLGQWILAEAWRQSRQWQTSFDGHAPLSISVNLSPRQLSDPGLLTWVQRIRSEEDLQPSALRLEITESIMIEDVASTTALIAQLREMGIGIHIDDFGTGYSSLSSLPLFPVDALKIDRSFIARMLESPRTEQVVRTIIALAHTLGLDVTAEGVETAEQWRKLRQLDCTQAQGYYFAPPLDKAKAEALIRKQATWE